MNIGTVRVFHIVGQCAWPRPVPQYIGCQICEVYTVRGLLCGIDVMVLNGVITVIIFIVSFNINYKNIIDIIKTLVFKRV